MHWMRRFVDRLGSLLGRSQADADLAEELAQHIALLEDDLVSQGVPPIEARRRARLAVRATPTTEAVREEWRFPAVERLWQDLRITARGLRRAPTFTVASILTLAIGIGATTTVFSLVNLSLLKPLPYPRADRLVTLVSGATTNFTGEELHALGDRVHSLQAMGWSGGGRNWNLAIDDRATTVTGGLVSAGMFGSLGVAPRLGRTFDAVEDARNGPAVVVLSDQLWQAAFQSRGDVIGTAISLGGTPHEVVGVMPPGFRTVPHFDLWTPLRLSPTNRGRNQAVVARLRDDVSLAQARAELSALTPELGGALGQTIARASWQDYHTSLGEPHRQALTILLAAVVCVLLIACVNVAGLQLVRTTARRAETATRAAIGGGPRRLMLETLTESLLLSGVGAVLGVAGAKWALPRVAALLPPSVLEDRIPTIEPGVLGVALAMAVGTGLLFGYLPAREAARVDVRAAMGAAGRLTAAASTLRWRRILAISQIALALMLLVGAGLLGRTLLSLYGVTMGFDPSGLVVGRMSLAGTPDPGGVTIGEFFERTLVRLRDAPGVRGAAVTSSIPVDRALNLALEPPPGSLVSEVRSVDWRYVSSGFFELLAIPLRAGRAFAPTDTATSPAVVIVNEAFAAAYFGREPAVGRSIRLAFGDDSPAMTIVGVVGDMRNGSGAGWARTGHALKQATAPGLFVPASQGAALLAESGLDAQWIVRTSAGTDAAAAALTDLVRAAEPRLPVGKFRSMADVIGSHVGQERALFWLLAAFAGVALLLACVGTYGMMAYSVGARSREIGIRMACGASASGVLRLFLREAIVVLAAGAVVGLAGGMVLANAIRAYVWGIGPFDPMTFLGASLAFALAVLLAVAAPAARAARLDPARVLRQG